MIYTITLSPAIDYKIKVRKFEFERTLRADSSYLEAGGKGINVSMVLDELDVKNTALLTIGGATKELFLNLLGSAINSKKIFETKNNVRINVKGRDDEKGLEINDRTKVFTNQVKNEIKKYLEQHLNDGDYVVFAGSPPTGIDEDIFGQLIEGVAKNIHIIIDSRKEYIVPLFKRGIFLLKPNLQELEDFSNDKINNEDDIRRIAQEVLEKGVENVLISMDKKGSILYSKNFVEKKTPLKNLPIVETTGAGDSMVAGFIAAHSRGMNLELCHKWAIASAIATVTSPSLAKGKDFKKWLAKI